MRVLVLGGTGAMGESLAKMLGERGDEVYVTSRSEMTREVYIIFRAIPTIYLL